MNRDNGQAMYHYTLPEHCLDHLEEGLLPQKWMGQKIAPIHQEAGCDVDYEWQVPGVEWWLNEFWDVELEDH